MGNIGVDLDLRPDVTRLDEEWVGQPQLRLKYGVLLADAKKELLTLKADLEVTEAELELAIRGNPSQFDIDKVTEATIKAAVPVQKEYRQAKKAVIEQQHEVDVLEAAVSAIDHRKKALEDLVQLHLSDYFAAPRAAGAMKDEVDDARKGIVRRKGRDRGSR